MSNAWDVKLVLSVYAGASKLETWNIIESNFIFYLYFKCKISENICNISEKYKLSTIMTLSEISVIYHLYNYLIFLDMSKKYQENVGTNYFANIS